MTRLQDLKAANSLHAFATVLDYKAKGLAYIVHGIDDSAKYKDFQIPKRTGGLRTISAPIPELKLLQKRLASLLEHCVKEIDDARHEKNTLSHGFRRKHSIMTNAAPHRGSRYVFNIDLRDFFGTINFGRVWRFFEMHREFKLNSNIARTIAQIACHKKTLPQGSPCSPVISNLIGHILDIRMVQLAARVGCHYTRYADDLIFSTNRKDFPQSIAKRIDSSTQWLPGKLLIREIKRCGFEVNPMKTRMQFQEFRQDVTGIIVNSKLNVRAEYAKATRAMVHSLVTQGEFEVRKKMRDDKGAWVEKKEKGTRPQLRGMLSFIDSVRQFEKNKNNPKKSDSTELHKPRVDIKEMDGQERLYRRFLLYTQFFSPDLPHLICEGKTDNIYIQCALRHFAPQYPDLITLDGKKAKYGMSFFKYTQISERILHLGGGTGDMCNFIAQYGREYDDFKPAKKRKPIVILIDNDAGAEPIFSAIKRATKVAGRIDGTEPYYFIRDNLYVVPVPKIKGKLTAIEDFFEKSVLQIKLGGKVFSRTDKFDPATEYGKHLFSEHVVKKYQATIDFSAFAPILKRIHDVLSIHAAKP